MQRRGLEGQAGNLDRSDQARILARGGLLYRSFGERFERHSTGSVQKVPWNDVPQPRTPSFEDYINPPGLPPRSRLLA